MMGTPATDGAGQDMKHDILRRPPCCLLVGVLGWRRTTSHFVLAITPFGLGVGEGLTICAASIQTRMTGSKVC